MFCLWSWKRLQHFVECCTKVLPDALHRLNCCITTVSRLEMHLVQISWKFSVTWIIFNYSDSSDFHVIQYCSKSELNSYHSGCLIFSRRELSCSEVVDYDGEWEFQSHQPNWMYCTTVLRGIKCPGLVTIFATEQECTQELLGEFRHGFWPLGVPGIWTSFVQHMSKGHIWVSFIKRSWKFYLILALTKNLLWC